MSSSKKPPQKSSSRPHLRLVVPDPQVDAGREVKVPHGGEKGAAEMLALLDSETRERILSEVAEAKPGLATNLRKQMLRFEDLLQVEAQALQKFFPEVPVLQWALALRGWDEESTRKLLSVLPARAAQMIREERELIGPRPVRDVELARQEICEKAQVKGLLPLQPHQKNPRPASR